MDANTIDALSALNPESQLPAVSLGAMLQNNRWAPLHNEARDRFLAKYIQTNFGYFIASQFANHRLPFPLALLGRDQWVYKAYLMKMDPWTNYDPHIAEAYHFAHYVRDKPAMAATLKALLLSFNEFDTPEQHIQSVHEQTKIPIPTLDAFEILFFNVIDRRGDHFFLSQEVYPDTRMVEVDEEYLKNSAHSDIIKRVAYNHRDMDLTAYLAGLGDHSYLKKVSASEDREADLTRYLMGNGLMLAHSNLLNQRTIGMSRVSTLLAASRQGGKEQEEPTLGGIVPMYTAAYRTAVHSNQKTVFEQMREDEGIINV